VRSLPMVAHGADGLSGKFAGHDGWALGSEVPYDDLEQKIPVHWKHSARSGTSYLPDPYRPMFHTGDLQPHRPRLSLSSPTMRKLGNSAIRQPSDHCSGVRSSQSPRTPGSGVEHRSPMRPPRIKTAPKRSLTSRPKHYSLAHGVGGSAQAIAFNAQKHAGLPCGTFFHPNSFEASFVPSTMASTLPRRMETDRGMIRVIANSFASRGWTPPELREGSIDPGSDQFFDQIYLGALQNFKDTYGCRAFPLIQSPLQPPEDIPSSPWVTNAREDMHESWR